MGVKHIPNGGAKEVDCHFVSSEEIAASNAPDARNGASDPTAPLHVCLLSARLEETMLAIDR